jgi:hypothetical protein
MRDANPVDDLFQKERIDSIVRPGVVHRLPPFFFPRPLPLFLP